ncbi:oligosaccharide flippase family protein [Sphingobacterium sp. WM]|uniref:oligosaccharide flippase family protein n=1 Tax=Sphingobacterium sp. WM TaxID=3031802 RepID=UPI00240D3C37|nr:oligosaccharide flippase family protein [Sphingobacterium sp. WM]WFB63287.1 oligosaccharide flippase family protein [Sphingobacterium sp. WM]
MINKIKKIISTKDGRAIAENLISLSALQLVGIILPLITLPYVLRVIGFENYGVIVLSASLITYFQSLTDFSFRITATRDVAINRDNRNKLSEIYSKVISVKIIFLIISYIVIFFLINFVPKFETNKTVYYLSSLMLFGYALFPEWFFQGVEKMKYITILNIGVKVFFTIMIFVFIRSEEDYWKYPLLQALGFIGAGVIGQFVLVKKYNLKFKFISLIGLFTTIKENTPIFINQFIPTLYNNSSVFILGLLTNNTLVGIYNAILVVINLIITILEIFSRVFFPFLNRRKDKFPDYLRMTLTITILMLIVILLLNKLVFWYLNVNYDNSFYILLILSIGVIGYSMYNVFGTNYFLVHRKDKIVMWNTIFSSIVGVLIVYPLIHFFGILGAAINLTFCRLLMGGGLFIKYLRIQKSETI